MCFCSLGFNLLGNIFQFVNQYVNCFFDTFFQNHRVSAGSNVAHAFVNHSLCQNGSSGGAVTGNIVGFDGYFFNQLCAHIFKRIFQFDVAGNGYTVIGDGRCAEFLFQNNVTAFRTEGYFYSVSQSIYATLQATTSFFIKQNLFSHFISLLKLHFVTLIIDYYRQNILAKQKVPDARKWYRRRISDTSRCY